MNRSVGENRRSYKNIKDPNASPDFDELEFFLKEQEKNEKSINEVFKPENTKEEKSNEQNNNSKLKAKIRFL
jgi:hypothetical protein